MCTHDSQEVAAAPKYLLRGRPVTCARAFPPFNVFVCARVGLGCLYLCLPPGGDKRCRVESQIRPSCLLGGQRVRSQAGGGSRLIALGFLVDRLIDRATHTLWNALLLTPFICSNPPQVCDVCDTGEEPRPGDFVFVCAGRRAEEGGGGLHGLPQCPPPSVSGLCVGYVASFERRIHRLV